METPLLRRCDLVILRPDAVRSEVEQTCRDAALHACLSVCVATSRVECAAAILEDTAVKVTALVGFPFGACHPDVKRFEIETAIDAGAQEIECVLNLGWLKEGADAALLRELRDAREAAEERPVKVVIEMGLLTPDERRRAVHLICEAELQFLVTATGCSPVLATIEEVQFLREAAGPELGIKVTGGIRTREQAEILVKAGANRLGIFSLTPFLAEA